MKKAMFLSLLAGLIWCCPAANAQNSYIYTVAGTEGYGFYGDGGPATNAKLFNPINVCGDHAGNLFIVDWGNKRIRRVDAATHVITTIAGNGTAGYTGDGGPATAASFDHPMGIAADGAGNIYIADRWNNVIRKVNTSGIISTFAGTGLSWYGGDGGAANAAYLSGPTAVATDPAGNVYIADNGNGRIRKVNTAGIISTIGGGGVPSAAFSAGMPATSANVSLIYNLAADIAGNVYFVDAIHSRFLKITPAGLIYQEATTSSPQGVATDILGNVYMSDLMGIVVRKNAAGSVLDTLVRGAGGSELGDGGLAINGVLIYPQGMYADISGNLYIADQDNNRIRVVTTSNIPTYHADSFAILVNELCSGVSLTVTTESSAGPLHAVSDFGDGSKDTTTVFPAYGGVPGYVNFTHNYAFPGTYTLRTKLMSGSTVVDSLVYTYERTQCFTIPIKFFWDNNGNCVKDGTESFNSKPVNVRVDSNGVYVRNISCTGGLYYTAHGVPGDVYSFKILPASGLTVVCPASGIIYDTLMAGVYNEPTKYAAIQCPGTGYDLSVTNVVPVTGQHDQWGNIYVRNNRCTPTDATVTLHYDKHYNVARAYTGLDVSPAPVSYTDSTVTWNFPGLAVSMMPVNIYYAIWTDLVGVYISDGNPIHTQVIVTPETGDSDTANNCQVRTDTVRASCDPNEMWASPACIPSGNEPQTLQYTVHFTNVGHDTAFNIHVMDTLSAYVDPQSLDISLASNTMNIAMLTDGPYNIVKFDFPHINLLDSTHCPQCGGAVVFNINTLPGLPDGTQIQNRAGIYFDYNDVVMTNAVQTIKGCPTPTLVQTLPTNTTHIFPNPATTQLTIQTAQPLYTKLSITNSIGQSMLQQDMSGMQTQVDIEALPMGIYYITLTSNGESKVEKFVKW